MEKKWEDMTPEEKKQQRFRWWLEPDIEFVSQEAKQAFKARARRLIDVYQVKEPDRVPVSLPVGNMPAYLDGTDLHTVMYDHDRLIKAWERFNREFEMDTFSSPALVLPGRVYDLLDCKLYQWPGHGLPDNATGIQFVEGEYMKPDEYDLLLKNPSDFWQRVYMPRVFGAFESFRYLQPYTSIIELPAVNFIPYSRPDVQATMQRLIDIGQALAVWSEVIGDFSRRAMASGFPMLRGAMAKAPFDTLGDTLRGTQGIIMDMYRQPDKLLEALEVITKLTIDAALASANASRGLMVFFPLHKGADGWMSRKQFETFYWPSLKRVVNALVNEGIIATLFAEGSYETRLDSVNEFPRGAVAWMFDKTDMAKAKKALGDKCCISGNVPTSMLVTGQPAEVKAYCRQLIETCGKGGGYILSGGANIDNGNPENLRAMMAAAREYGVYRK
ncbi:MAG TPA: uroporphyrinogen decarboxylase family protein [Dehalococcoidales bacterium]|nr:uroporphyrinogen decarboxylase family protein [Dehalococcoidales bacterium]